MEIRIEKSADKAEVYTPYSKEFISELKKRVGGARWNASKRCWTVPEDALDAVRGIIKSVYGYTDQADAGRLCTATIRVAYMDAECAPVSIFNRVVARAYGRDSGATVGDGVVFKEGAPKSGGSAKYWKTIVDGCIVEMHHVPEAAIKNGLPGGCEILSITPEGEDDNRKRLLEEREKLLARLAEIDKELGEKLGQEVGPV